nr:hypothetical protein [Betaproteobacteria bacterium]
MAKFAVAIAAVAVLAGTGITSAATDEVAVASGASTGQGGELLTVAAAMGRGTGSQGGEAGSGGARHGGGGAHGGEAGWHGNRGNWRHGGDHGGRFHGRHHLGPRFGFGLALGAPFWWGPGYYPYPYYAPYHYDSPYTTFYAEPMLTRYVERDPGYRYYCTEPAGFYPEVQACPKAWLKVVPDGATSTS